MLTKKHLKPGSEFCVLFHKAWGQAKESPEYDKRVWIKLDKMIFESGDEGESDAQIFG